MTDAAGVFWSGETLKEQLPYLIEPYSDDRIDCSAYTLSIGPEVYVSPNDQSSDPTKVTVRKLAEDEFFTIPPGQFAFLLTEEVVRVPSDGIAFISIRARTAKFRGLVNVSGFHVDPGFHGQLTFAVFNAGPVTIHLKRGQPIFLIWYSKLDRETNFKKTGPIRKGIDPELILNISGELQSFEGLSRKIKDTEEALGEKIHAIEKEQIYYKVVCVIALGVVIAMLVSWIKDVTAPKPMPSTTTATFSTQLPSGQTTTILGNTPQAAPAANPLPITPAAPPAAGSTR